MADRVIAHSQPIASSRNGLLAKHVVSYQAFLEERRYAPRTRHTYHGDCLVAWTRKSGHHARLRRSRSDHEGARPGQASAPQDQIRSLSAARQTAPVPAEPLIFMRRSIINAVVFYVDD